MIIYSRHHVVGFELWDQVNDHLYNNRHNVVGFEFWDQESSEHPEQHECWGRGGDPTVQQEWRLHPEGETGPHQPAVGQSVSGSAPPIRQVSKVVLHRPDRCQGRHETDDGQGMIGLSFISIMLYSWPLSHTVSTPSSPPPNKTDFLLRIEIWTFLKNLNFKIS